MARYLVTGASGFVGLALCRTLSDAGHRVRALLRAPADGPWQERVIGELGGEGLPTGLADGLDGIFHLAGIAHRPDISGTDEAVYQRVNLDGTKALLDAARAAEVGRFVFFSSIKAVGDPGEHCVDESWDAPAEDAYGRSKREAEALVLRAGAEGGMHVCNLRPTLVYGPGVKGNLARMIDAVDAGRFPPLPETGNRRSMVGLDDLVDAAMLVMQRDAANGRTYIVADGEDYSTYAILAAMREALGRDAPGWTLPPWALRAGAMVGDLLQPLARPRLPLSSAVTQRLLGSACYRADRLRTEIGWRPRQTLRQALPAMVRERAGSLF